MSMETHYIMTSCIMYCGHAKYVQDTTRYVYTRNSNRPSTKLHELDKTPTEISCCNHLPTIFSMANIRKYFLESIETGILTLAVKYLFYYLL